MFSVSVHRVLKFVCPGVIVICMSQIEKVGLSHEAISISVGLTSNYNLGPKVIKTFNQHMYYVLVTL